MGLTCSHSFLGGAERIEEGPVSFTIAQSFPVFPGDYEIINPFRLFFLHSHGTRCAGEVSGARDNGVCGVGVAYDSMVAGIRMLDQPYMTDLIEANSMGHEPNLIDIYSASWGPTDDGRTVDGPRNATMRAIVRGVNEVSLHSSQTFMSFCRASLAI